MEKELEKISEYVKNDKNILVIGKSYCCGKTLLLNKIIILLLIEIYSQIHFNSLPFLFCYFISNYIIFLLKKSIISINLNNFFELLFFLF